MNPARADRLRALFERALELEPEQRRKFCDILGRRDMALATELDSLLAAHDVSGGLDAPAARMSPDRLDSRPPFRTDGTDCDSASAIPGPANHAPGEGWVASILRAISHWIGWPR
jgi:hypothetical protein